MSLSRHGISRRLFLGAAGAAGALPLLPETPTAAQRSRVRPGANEALAVACVGVGGMGRSDLGSIASAPDVRIVALCDVDANNLGAAAQGHEGAQTFRDYRRMFDAMADDIDAVVVSTPDHMHGPIAIAAMLRDKHVYCQKPIAHNLHECRRMTELAAERGLVTQMGTQIHAHEAYQTAIATLRSGVLGKVHRAHLWVGKSWAGPAGGRPDRTDPVPAHLDWDLWLGVAQERPYVDRVYHPANWRGWRDFGGGTLGDMGCHIFDPVFSALGLGSPTRATARGPAHSEETFAGDGDVEYLFPATPLTVGELPLRWSDGGARPRRKEIAELVQHMPAEGTPQQPGEPAPELELPGGGSFLVCEKGIMVLPHWGMPQFYKDGEVLDVELQRRPSGNHYHEWAAACRGEGVASTGFDYSGPLTEAVLLGTLAGAFPGEEVPWDPATATTTHEGVAALVRRTYREGWSME